MECHDVRLLLTFAQRGCEDLDAGELAALRKHLDSCPECANLAQTDRHLDETIGQLMRAVPVPAGLKEKVLARLVESHKGRPWKRIAVAAVAAALLIAVGTTAWFMHGPTEITLEIVSDYVYQGKEFDANQIKEYFARQGLIVTAPPMLRATDLQRADVVEFQNRRVARLSYASPTAAADVLILPAAQFRCDDLREIPGLVTVHIKPEGEFIYLIIMQRGDFGELTPLLS